MLKGAVWRSIHDKVATDITILVSTENDQQQSSNGGSSEEFKGEVRPEEPNNKDVEGFTPAQYFCGTYQQVSELDELEAQIRGGPLVNNQGKKQQVSSDESGEFSSDLDSIDDGHHADDHVIQQPYAVEIITDRPPDSDEDEMGQMRM